LGDTLGDAEANASVGSGDEDDFRHGGKDFLCSQWVGCIKTSAKLNRLLIYIRRSRS
jgi:hypothetical protein